MIINHKNHYFINFIQVFLFFHFKFIQDIIAFISFKNIFSHHFELKFQFDFY